MFEMELARDLVMSPSAIGYAIERGELIGIDNNFQLTNY
jgi:hypothetical protein